jgi:DNA polymerase III subunit delta
MAKALHVVDYLAQPEKHGPRPICVVFGDEPFLRRQAVLGLRAAVLDGSEAEFSFSAFEGREVELRDVLQELRTVAMFGAGKRLVLVEEADEFVTRYRGELEDYAAAPSATGVLVLEVKSFPATTRLYKVLATDGLLVDCSTPAGVQLTRWLCAWAKQAHQVQLPQAAAEELLEMVGPELGLLDQEIAKLALMTDKDRKITVEMVGRSVGGWRAKTTWDMLDAALDGKTPEALLQLDRLLASGEQPVGILGQISASLRRLAAATRLVVQAEAAGRRIVLRQALEQAGIKPFVLQKSEQQLRKLTRIRGLQLYQWLLEADLGLKGASPAPPRLILERLIVRMSAPLEEKRVESRGGAAG